MIRNKVEFRKFEVEPKKLLSKLRDYNHCYWPLDWTVIHTPLEYSKIKVWLKESTKEQYYIHPSYDGCIIAFKSKNDSIKFKLAN